jgi:glycosyltransferase involved in cell wall biosynthesis
MKLLMISGDRSVAAGKAGAFSETLKELHAHFERIDIICPRVSEQQVRVILGNVYLHPSPGGLLGQPWFILRKGKELFDAHHHDVMTVHDYPPFYNGFGAKKLKHVTGMPAVLELHHIIGWPQASSLQEFVGRVMSKVILPSHIKHFDAVRVVNSTVKNLLAQWNVPAEKISVVPSFYLDHALVASSKNQPKTFDLVFCARLVRNKGLASVFDALKEMPSATLLVIGDGELRPAMENRAKHFGHRVHFTGWLSTHAEVLKDMASAKVFVMNSTSEGGPRAALEAMALGLPILTTRVGVMPDVIEDGRNGIFTDGSAKDVADKAKILLADEPRMQLLGKEASRILNRFEKQSAIKTYGDFLKSFTVQNSKNIV